MIKFQQMSSYMFKLKGEIFMKNIKIKKKENRSVVKTKRKLKLGLISLLKERPASKITVKELCELVDINRGTFYYHYTDIFDMINKIEEEFFDEFNEIITAITTNGKKSKVGSTGEEDSSGDKTIDPLLIIEKVFEFFDGNAQLSSVLIGPNGDISFIQSLKELVDEKISDVWIDAGSHMDEREYELFNSFIINGYIGLLQTWLETGRKQSPKYMANFVAKIIIPAAVHTLAIDEDTYSQDV